MQLLARTLTCLVAVAAALLPALVAADVVEEKHFVLTCDGFDAPLQCSPNTVIEVQDAFYGRANSEYCTTGPKIHDRCSSGAIARVLASVRCNYKRSCRLPTNIYGDPCVGIFKYLQVTYVCKALPTVVACDGSVMGIQCPAGKFIAVRDAFYGRLSDEHCAFGPRLDYSCSLADAKSIITDSCKNKERCALGLLPDPCRGTLKYMTAVYECLDHQTHVACDGTLLSISCPPNTVIHVLSSFFGRTSDEYCAHGPRLTYACSSATAPQRIASVCNRQQQCKINLPELGDPCPNTLKYAEVKYRCA